MGKRLVYGWGINDINNSCGTVYYQKWSDMIKRVKHKEYLIENPIYKEYSICEDWLYLSNFKKWFDNANYIQGYQLDKDLLFPNNKEYNQYTCLFISQNINSLMCRQKGKGYSITNSGKFQTSIRVEGKKIHLGNYNTKEKAHQVYVEFKANRYVDIADTFWQTNEKIAIGLYRQAENLVGNDWRDLPY